MLRAMKEQLKYLSLDKEGKFHEALRDRVGKRATDILESRLKQIVVLTPDLVERIYVFWRNEKSTPKVKSLGAYLLTYLYLPKNFIPQGDWGLYGYLDDAYFVALMFKTVVEEAQQGSVKIKSADLALYDQVVMLMKDIRLVIPNEAKQIDVMMQELLAGKQDSFFNMVNR